MIVYNITMKLDLGIDEEWIKWQTEEHIPDIMSTGCYVDHKFFRLIDQDESDGNTYIVQYFANSRQDHENYISEFGNRLREKAKAKWGERFVSFRTLMEVVH